MYYTKRPFFLGEPPYDTGYDTGGGSAPGEPANTAKPPASFFNIVVNTPIQRPAPVYQPNYQSFFPPQHPAPTTVRPPLAPPTIVRPPIPTPERTYRVDVPTGVAVSKKQQPPVQTYVPPPLTPAPVYAPTNTQTNAPVYTGSTATHAEGGGYKGPTPVFATWSPGGSSSSSGGKQSAQDRRKANQIRAEQNKKAREQAAKAARDRQSKQQRKQADEYNKQQKKAAEAQKKADEQYFKQMEAQEKALMKDREAQVKAQREAAKQSQILAQQQSQLTSQQQQMERQRQSLLERQEQQRQAAEQVAQASTKYPYDPTPERYPEGAAPPQVVSPRAQSLVNMLYVTNADVLDKRVKGETVPRYSGSSAWGIIDQLTERGNVLKLGQPKVLTPQRQAEMEALSARQDYLTPDETVRLNQLKSMMTPAQEQIAEAVLGRPQRWLEAQQRADIYSKLSTATSPSAGGLISPESTDAEQSAAYGQRVEELASKFNENLTQSGLIQKVDLLSRLEQGNPDALRQLRAQLTDDEYAKFRQGFAKEAARGIRSAADKLATKEQPSFFKSLLVSAVATPAVRDAAIEAANVRDFGPDYKQWIAQQTAQPAPITQLPPEGWIADPSYGEQQALQQKFDYPIFGDNLTQLETAVAPMQQQPSVADQAAANIAEIQKQISANDQQVAAANERLSVPIDTYQPFKSNLLDTEEAVAREYLNQQPSTPMTVLDKVPVRPAPAVESSYGFTNVVDDARKTVSAGKKYSSFTSLLDPKNIGPSILDLDRMQDYVLPPKAQPVSFSILKPPKLPTINSRLAVPIDNILRLVPDLASAPLKSAAGAIVPQELQQEAYDSVDAVTKWGGKLLTDTNAGDALLRRAHDAAFKQGLFADTVGAAAQRVGGSLVNVAQKIPGVAQVSPYATKMIRFLASSPVSAAGAVASGVVDTGRILHATNQAWQAEEDAKYQKQDYEQLRDERINTMNREEARLVDRKKVLDYRIGEYDRWIKSNEFYYEGAWGREKFARAMDKIALMKEQLKLVDDSLQNISQDRLKDAQQYQARGLQAQEAARRQAEADAIERMNLEASIYSTYGGF